MTYLYQTLDTFTEIGRIASTHGLEGNVYFIHKLKGKQASQKLKFLFIELKPESYIPFKIRQHKSIADGEAIVMFDGIENVETAKKIAGKRVFLPEEQYNILQPKEVSLDFSGFILYDQYDKKVGRIEQVFESPGQLLASVRLPNEKEALVPVVESFILSINVPKKELTLSIPDGLIDIYL